MQASDQSRHRRGKYSFSSPCVGSFAVTHFQVSTPSFSCCASKRNQALSLLDSTPRLVTSISKLSAPIVFLFAGLTASSVCSESTSMSENPAGTSSSHRTLRRRSICLKFERFASLMSLGMRPWDLQKSFNLIASSSPKRTASSTIAESRQVLNDGIAPNVSIPKITPIINTSIGLNRNLLLVIMFTVELIYLSKWRI